MKVRFVEDKITRQNRYQSGTSLDEVSISSLNPTTSSSLRPNLTTLRHHPTSGPRNAIMWTVRSKESCSFGSETFQGGRRF